MTNKEALKYFTRRKTQLGLSDNVQQAENCAITSLERQIPKKPLDKFSTHPIFDPYGNYCDQLDITTFKCPTCNDELASGEIETTDCVEIHYCSNCGQALDWSDTE